MQKYDKKELSALVRLQFEERRNIRRRRKQRKESMSQRSRSQLQEETLTSNDEERHNDASVRFVNIADEVMMIEGALQMETTTVKNVMTKWKEVRAATMQRG